MGLLDDAIREHLELKRRRGADASELARLEHDAFGPVRGAERDEDAAAEPPRAAVKDAIEPAETPLPDPAPEPEPEPLPDPAPIPDPEPYGEVEPPARQRAAAEPLPPLDDPEPEDPQATVSFTLDEEVEAGAPTAEDAPADPDVVAADEEHDELEETPEFLQETPEHDRLWFEQKPPRDFDF
ncbi:MAG TPA: hypothetical protein VFZ89_08175 [Solirubrobacteraceae bacterium]